MWGSTGEKKTRIIQEPSTLILQLMRYSFDKSTNEALKLSDSVACPVRITLPSGTIYSLNSITNHIGEDTKSGHYNVILHDRNNDNFVLLDDSAISIVDSINEVSKVSYILYL